MVEPGRRAGLSGGRHTESGETGHYEVPIVCAGKVRMPRLAEKILEEGRSRCHRHGRDPFADLTGPY